MAVSKKVALKLVVASVLKEPLEVMDFVREVGVLVLLVREVLAAGRGCSATELAFELGLWAVWDWSRSAETAEAQLGRSLVLLPASVSDCSCN